jgi:hypothetical protein
MAEPGPGTAEGFTVAYGATPLCGDWLRVGAAAFPAVLCLHGAGRSCRRSFLPLRRHLYGQGLDSCAFDFVGHGQTGGALEGQTLAARTAQACRVIDTQALAWPLTLVGISMGAYIALRLTAIYPTAALVLIVPAVYSAAAYGLPFGPAFRGAIRRYESWRDSDAWELVARFAGHLLIVAGERDAVIPAAVTDGLAAAARLATRCRHVIAPGASHRALTDLRRQRPREYRRVLDLIAETCHCR